MLEEFTPVENTAGIFFDFNDPVITNTTLHTFVSEIPIDSAIDLEDSRQSLIKIYPVPAHDIIYMEVEEPMTVQIFDMLGNMLAVEKLPVGATELDVSMLNVGIYMVRADNGKAFDVKKIIVE